MAFAEQATPQELPIFRTAVVMPFADAILLVKVLETVLRGIEQQLEAAKAAATKAEAAEADGDL